MTLVLLVAALTAATVVLTGGARQLARLKVRAVRLLVVAAFLQVATMVAAPESAELRLVSGGAMVILVALFLAGNITTAGVPLVAAGLAANVLVIAANGAMPVSVAVAERTGITLSQLQLDTDPLREPLSPSSRFKVLADRIPVAVPWRPQLVSAGDVLVASGVALLLIMGSRPQQRAARNGRVDLDGEAHASERESRSTA